MCHAYLIVLIPFLLAGCVGLDAPTVTEEAGSVEDPIEQIATEFRSLRLVRGQFDGGTWNDDVDLWMGRKHKLMLDLASQLTGGDYDKTEIMRLLDAPDEIAHAGDPLFEQITMLPEYEIATVVLNEFLIYYWRGTHDFLFFVNQDDKIIGSDWWFAGD